MKNLRSAFNQFTRFVSKLNNRVRTAADHSYDYDFMRRWVYTPVGNAIHRRELLRKSVPFTFTLCSYNVLSQTLLEKNFNLYADIDPRYLYWEHRFKVLANEMAWQSADVYCLQEVDAISYYKDYEKFFLSKGYTGIYAKRPGDKVDGCAIFVKDKMFEIVDQLAFPFIRKDCTLLDRDNIAILVKLNPRHTSNNLPPIIVGTTHLLFNPNYGDVKLAQTQLLLAEIERFALDRIAFNSMERQYFPILMTGDFNSCPHSAIYALMTGKELDLSAWKAGMVSGQFNDACSRRPLPDTLIPFSLGISDYCRYSRSMRDVRSKSLKSNYDPYGTGKLQSLIKMQSAYPQVDRLGRQYISTKHGLGLSGHCWDFIFYSMRDNNQEGCLKCLATLDLATVANGPQLLFPSKKMGSDHLGLYSKFALVPKEEDWQIAGISYFMTDNISSK